MLTLPEEYHTLFTQIQPHFSKRVWKLAKVMLVGSILAPGKRTVTSVLRIMGLSQEKQFQKYHRVLNRAIWSGLELSKTLLQILLKTFFQGGEVVIGIDETIERRRGKKIRAKGIYRDPVRSSKNHFVKASGLRWISMMLLVRIPWAKPIWGLPFLTVLAPSIRSYEDSPREHKKLTDGARQMGKQVRRWLPEKKIMLVADSSYAVLALLHQLLSLPKPVYMVTQLRLDAALYEPAPTSKPGAIGRPRKKGNRLPKLKDVLDDPQTAWQQVTVNNWYGKGPTEVEITSDTAVWYHSGKPVVPPHLGVETQRQWSDKAIARTTPILLALFSWVTLLANQSKTDGRLSIRQAAWYEKSTPTFSDAIALVRRRFGENWSFSMSSPLPDVQKLPGNLYEQVFEAICYSF
jgi:hypothetical protein